MYNCNCPLNANVSFLCCWCPSTGRTLMRQTLCLQRKPITSAHRSSLASTRSVWPGTKTAIRRKRAPWRFKGQMGEERRWVLQTLCPLSHWWHSHSQLLMDHLVKKNGQRVMEVTAHHDNLRPPFMKKHLSPDKPKGHDERRLQQSGGMWSLFSYSHYLCPTTMFLWCVVC